MTFRSTAFLLFLAGSVAGCAADSDGEPGAAGAGALEGAATQGLLYFHGMSHLGFDARTIKTVAGGREVLAPSMSDAELRGDPPQATLDFLGGHATSLASGYSLGRLPVLELMRAQATGMTRVVLIDPTFDTDSLGGGVSREWLDAANDRSLLFVYGDVTKQVAGERSYIDALTGHPRADLCFIPGDHTRFRAADMAVAIVATSCTDLKSRLAHPHP